MGLIPVLSLLTTAVSAVSQYRAGKKATKARIETNNIKTASEKNKDRSEKRRLARAERIKRAQIESRANSTGASDSSGELGALSGLSSNVGASLANQKEQATTAEGLSFQQQNIADAEQSARNAKLFSGLVQSGIDTYEEYQK